MRKALSFASACCVLAAIAFVTVSPIEWRPPDILGTDVDRALAFAILGALFTTAYPRRWRQIAFGMAAVAGGLEIMQIFSETRHAELSDALVKISGSLIGIACALAARQIWFLLRDRQTTKNLALANAGPKISTVFFDPADGLLHLRFSNGEEQVFAGVNEGSVIGLREAAEPMRYFLEHIEPHYERRAA